MRMNFDNDAQGKGGNERAGRLLRFLALTLALAGGALWVGGVDTAGAHSDNCPSGQTAVVGTSVCVPAGEIEFADWCQTVASSPRDLGQDQGRNVLTCGDLRRMRHLPCRPPSPRCLARTSAPAGTTARPDAVRGSFTTAEATPANASAGRPAPPAPVPPGPARFPDKTAARVPPDKRQFPKAARRHATATRTPPQKPTARRKGGQPPSGRTRGCTPSADSTATSPSDDTTTTPDNSPPTADALSPPIRASGDSPAKASLGRPMLFRGEPTTPEFPPSATPTATTPRRPRRFFKPTARRAESADCREQSTRETQPFAGATRRRGSPAIFQTANVRRDRSPRRGGGTA